MSIVVHDIKELDPKPKRGKRIMADLFGNGKFIEYSVIFVGKTCMKIRRLEDKTLEIVVKINTTKYKEKQAFWYEKGAYIEKEGQYEKILYFQSYKDEA